MEANKLILYLLYQLYNARVILHSLKEGEAEEDIHEFRVTLRGVRSLVKLFPENSIPFPKKLKTAMQATNPIRELDVLIHSLSRSRYPKLFKHLTKLRKEKFLTLFTPSYIQETLSWIDEYSHLLFQNNPEYISEILIQKVLTHYQHCLDAFRALESGTDPKTLHHLRIEFKDARYGFEFLEISDMHHCREIISHCKKLQNILGAIQDSINQIDLLTTIYQEYPSTEAKELLKKEKKVLQKLTESTQSALSASI